MLFAHLLEIVDLLSTWSRICHTVNDKDDPIWGRGFGGELSANVNLLLMNFQYARKSESSSPDFYLHTAVYS